MKISTLSVLVAIFFVTSCASAQFPVNKLEPLPLPNFSGKHIVVDKSTQRWYFRDGDTVIKESACGTGTEFNSDDITPRGSHTIMWKAGPGYVSKKYKVPMPYALQITASGVFMHGSNGFVTVKEQNQGMPQSHGCIRLPVPVAKWFYEQAYVGLPVYVIGDIQEFIQSSGFLELVDYEGEGTMPVMKINRPNPSPEDIKRARELFLDKRLFIKLPDNGSRDKRKCLVGYPFFPEASFMPLLKFESLILTPEEKANGIEITLD